MKDAKSTSRAAASASLDHEEKWTLRDVARFLKCSDDHAARWLERKGVRRFDIGEGRQVIRVLRGDVESAFFSSAIDAGATEDPAGQNDPVAGAAPRGYVPKYRPPAATAAAKPPRRRAG